MKRLKCSCGTSWMPLRVRIILSKHFEEACLEHDKNYGENMTQREADRIFFIHMIKISATLNHNVKWTMFACFYYWALRILGHFAYNIEQKRKKEE